MVVGIVLFADKAIVILIIKSTVDNLNLQTNLDKFIIWNYQSCFPLNINKCKIITFSRIDNVIIYNYKINNCPCRYISDLNQRSRNHIFLEMLTDIGKKSLVRRLAAPENVNVVCFLKLLCYNSNSPYYKRFVLLANFSDASHVLQV